MRALAIPVLAAVVATPSWALSTFHGSHNGRLYAIDATSGKLAWEFRTEAARRSPPSSAIFRT